MIAVDEAQARVLALAVPVSTETMPLRDAAGRWSAEPVRARRTQPARDLSAMDGYAIRYGDLPGPWRVIGESAPGMLAAMAIKAGEAVRIFTGAALPSGSDTILIQEEATWNGDQLALSGEGPQAHGAHVRRAASDFAEGDVVIAQGTALTPARIALAAMAGHGHLKVARRLRVALLSTGNELIAPGTACGDHQLPSSNALMLAALLRDLSIDLTDLGIIADDRAALTEAFALVRDHDLILSTGGASVGDHDLVGPALMDAGARIAFWKVAMRPGKPLMAGKLDAAVVLGLPGNPVSAFVTAILFARPLVARLGGAVDPLPRRIAGELGAPLPAVGMRTDFVRACWNRGRLHPLPGDSGALTPLAETEALIVRHAGAPAAASGARVEAILFA